MPRRDFPTTGMALTHLLVVADLEPTAGKPPVTFAPSSDPDTVSHAFTVRVPGQAAYETLLAPGATFLTPPHDWGGEARAFFRDPDGNLFEISAVGPG